MSWGAATPLLASGPHCLPGQPGLPCHFKPQRKVLAKVSRTARWAARSRVAFGSPGVRENAEFTSTKPVPRRAEARQSGAARPYRISRYLAAPFVIAAGWQIAFLYPFTSFGLGLLGASLPAAREFSTWQDACRCHCFSCRRYAKIADAAFDTFLYGATQPFAMAEWRTGLPANGISSWLAQAFGTSPTLT